MPAYSSTRDALEMTVRPEAVNPEAVGSCSATQPSMINYNERGSVMPTCSRRRMVVGALGFAVFIGLGVIFPLSWQTLPYSELGLDFNSVNGFLDTSKTYERGRHLLGIGHVFMRFPRTVQTIDFAPANALETDTQLTSIPVVSSDGQLVSIQCSVWFRLVPAELGELYLRYSTRYASNLAKAARQAITEAGSLFETTEFYQRRIAVRETMRDAVAGSFAAYPVEFVELWLWQVTVPGRIDDAILAKLLSQQLKQTMLFAQQATLVEEQTLNFVALSAIEEARVLQGAQASALLETATAEATATNVTGRAMANGLSGLRSGLDWHGTSALKWLWWDTAKSAALRWVTPGLDVGSSREL